MKLPNAQNAVISSSKLRNYILSTTHPLGRYKARFFAKLGYTERDWQKLASDLKSQHLDLDAEEAASTEHGQKFVITGTLTGPSGERAEVRSVWIIDRGKRAPRLVSLYPSRRRSRWRRRP